MEILSENLPDPDLRVVHAHPLKRKRYALAIHRFIGSKKADTWIS
jgi:hypothetical protein